MILILRKNRANLLTSLYPPKAGFLFFYGGAGNG